MSTKFTVYTNKGPVKDFSNLDDAILSVLKSRNSSKRPAMIKVDLEQQASREDFLEELRSSLEKAISQLEEPADKQTPFKDDMETCHFLPEVYQLTSISRNSQYGHPFENFTHTANLWNAFMGDRLTEEGKFTAHDVALLMAMVKMSRMVTSPDNPDHWKDLAGYMRLGHVCVQNERNQGMFD